MTPNEFVNKWQAAAGKEIANSQSFLIDLCELLDVEKPRPTVSDDAANTYVFEKGVTFNNGDGSTSQGRVDLYRQGCFVLESKQGSERKSAEEAEALAEVTKNRRLLKGTAQRGSESWRQAMTKAYRQVKRYAEALPEWPPILIVADIGHCFDLYADFSGTGKLYQPFPDPKTFRIPLADIVHPERGQKTLAMLRAVWQDPQSLDPAKRAAKATRDLAAKLAELAKRLEGQIYDEDTATEAQGADAPRSPKGSRKKHSPEAVAQFLMRCLFTMFAEDLQVGGFRKDDFRKFLEARRDDPSTLKPMLEALWSQMNTGGFSTVLARKILEFNGGLFSECQAIPLTADQLELLIEAARADWSDVEPAIFGTLLERALDPHERHKLGAHYTPRAYVERLVMPTIIEPLREEWDDVYAEAIALVAAQKPGEARRTVREFHEKLCETRVLDPACGSGNFLYVSLELMKRLEGEVLNALREFGENQLPLLTIDPHQFLGIEVNPRAAAIADLVLWIGYLQWHFRTRGPDTLAEPIIRKFHNIECRDAMLAWDSVEPVVNEEGQPVTRWDGRTTKTHPVTREEVPDETARVQEMRYVNPRKAEWPKADYIVGNPPFVGNKRMKTVLGDGYVKAIRDAFRELPESIDYVMYWWHSAAHLLGQRLIHRSGLITTNSITQTFNNRVVRDNLVQSQASIVFAIPDHPWVDSSDGASVRIAMTVLGPGGLQGVLYEVQDSSSESDNPLLTSKVGEIAADLTVGVNLTSVQKLASNQRLACPGVQLSGQGFVISPAEAKASFGEADRLLLRPYITGRDITQLKREQYVLDTYGISLAELTERYPATYQWLSTRVKPERDQNPREKYAKEWWLHSEPRGKFRRALDDLEKIVVTSRTSRHRFFQFVGSRVLPETKVLVFALQDPASLAVLSSRIHVVFANRVGGWLGVGNDSTYNHSVCFESFPFPDMQGDLSTLRKRAEQLDTHRKRQQQLHPDLTMTGMYNVLEKLRSGEPLTAKEQVIHEQGLVSVLKQIHDELDAAVFEAYGWPATLTDEEILERLVALNHERAEEEKRGLVRWLRPEFQNPSGQGKTQQRLDVEEADDEEDEQPAKGRKTKGKKAGKGAAGTAGAAKGAKRAKKQAWPAKLAERIKAVRGALVSTGKPATLDDIAAQFTRPKKEQVGEVLEVLLEVGQARLVGTNRFVA
ncbi:hypothetical protein Pan44_18060 [Caulifigura coniformis]|uniref:site-specific DNA-methyltransferase (adenine-specific) n=1 Tax=Caulifigura coniformis TaxID=2527983 RepID=A0A517SCD2_9PLAN|nr:DNA methyltransferase [Caulifigura coniformis]QDT53782.1 hypothetical protein Pan44_18060 [Caulifigura coniformis]